MILAVAIIGFVIFEIWYFTIYKRKESIETIDELTQSRKVIKNNFNKIKKYVEKNISKSYLTNCSWILSNITDIHILYTFKNNNELLITTNGIVEKGYYELIIDSNSILITRNSITEHFNIVNVQNDFLFLNKVSTDLIMVFANQTKFKDELKSIILEEAKSFYNYEVK